MPLTLITGPMKSGKSLELIARVEPFVYAKKKILYVQSKHNVRDTGVSSRLGLQSKACSVSSLADVTTAFDVVGIDEINMFNVADAAIISDWLKAGKDIYISGLDLDYRALIPPIVTQLLRLQPDEIIRKIAVCDVCASYTARFTQILHNAQPVLEGLPLITPEDGIYEYQARCRLCFVRSDSTNS